MLYKTKRWSCGEYSSVFGGKNGGTVASLCYAKFTQAVVTCGILEPETLSLTERAMCFHSL